jgi:C-methyltransferase C-terminal domain/Putative zinc binding domain/Methyltransferase domain
MPREDCRVCARPAVGEWLDFGPQAIRNRFLRSREEHEYRHGLAIGCCAVCGTVQLASPPPVTELRPRFDWISYNEPERHLDELVEHIARLPGVTAQSVFAGVSYKDDSTLARLARRGVEATWRPDPRRDLGIDVTGAGIESIQERLAPGCAGELVARHGRPRVLIVRHVLEHAHDTPAALAWARGLVGTEGYVVIEVPDATRALERLDYTTVWEEHVLYFTPVTLRGCLERAEFEVVSLESYPYTLENSLVAIVRAVRVNPEPASPAAEFDRAQRFIRQFSRTRERIQQRIRAAGRVAMLGAGHLAGAFINLYGLENTVEFVVDDNPNKQGLFMPGSRLPILPSSELNRRKIDLCLMTVRPEIEIDVARRNEAFRSRGGVLASVFPDSPFAIGRTEFAGGVIA